MERLWRWMSRRLAGADQYPRMGFTVKAQESTLPTMKDARREHFPKFESSDALDRVQAALEALWEDTERSVHDKIAVDFDYEELIAALLSAEAALKEASTAADEEEE